MKRIVAGLFALLLCGCSEDDDLDFSSMRFLHAMTAVDSIDVAVDDVLEVTDQSFGDDSGYLVFDEGGHRVEIFDTGLSTSLLDFRLDLDVKTDYTIVAVSIVSPPGIHFEPFVYPDDNREPDEGKTRLRFIQAAPRLGRVDLYVVRERDPLEGIPPDASDIALGDASTYIEKDFGDYVLHFTPTGSKEPFLTSRIVSFDDGEVRTAFLLDDPRLADESRLLILRDRLGR